MKIKNDLGAAFNHDILTSLTLIDTLVKPILMYNSDFWGCLKLPKNNPIDTFHLKMCKKLLGVNKSTTTAGVLLELGRITFQILTPSELRIFRIKIFRIGIRIGIHWDPLGSIGIN